MADPIGPTILQILKLLTPSDINRMSSKVELKKKVSLTSILEGVDLTEAEGENAKAILTKKEKAGEEKKDAVKEFGKKRVPDGYKMPKKKRSKLEDPRIEQGSTKFVLGEKKKLEIMQEFLKKGEILQLYSECSDVELIEKGDSEFDTPDEGLRKGILLNKKQF